MSGVEGGWWWGDLQRVPVPDLSNQQAPGRVLTNAQ